MGVKIEHGVQAFLAGVFLFAACRQVRPPTVTETPVQPGTSQSRGEQPEALYSGNEVFAVNVKYTEGFVEEKRIINETRDKIPAAEFLTPGGIYIYRSRYDATKGAAIVLGAYQPQGVSGDAFLVEVAADFTPNSTEMGYPSSLWRTQEEQLKWQLAFEYGQHLIRITSEVFSTLNSGGLDADQFLQKHPFLETFSQVVGWEENKPEVTSKLDLPPDLDTVTAFDWYFAASIFRQEALSEQERRYFNNIHDGLRGNPQGFIEEVDRDPQILLR